MYNYFLKSKYKKQKNSKPTSNFCNFAACVYLQSVYYTIFLDATPITKQREQNNSIKRAMPSNFQTKNQVHLYRHICSSPSIFSLINQVKKVGYAFFVLGVFWGLLYAAFRLLSDYLFSRTSIYSSI